MFAQESRSPTLRQLVVVYILPCQSVPVKFELKMCKVCFDESELELGRRALLAQRSCKGPRYRFPGRPEAAIRPRGSWALTSFVQWRSRGITKTGYLKFQLHTIFSEKKSIFITQKSVFKKKLLRNDSVIFPRKYLLNMCWHVEIPHHIVPVQRIR